MNEAMIVATAYIGDTPMKDSIDRVIDWRTECSTDIPADALGEAAVLALRQACTTGIDPMCKKGFHLRITFE